MRRHIFIACAISLSFAAAAARAAEELRGVPGVLFSDGTFRPNPPRPANAPMTATVSRAGQIKLTATIKLFSPASELTPSSIKCSFVMSVYDTDGYNSNTVVEEDRNPATVSGTTATCTMSIPYNWSLYAPDNDLMNFTLTAAGFDANGKGRSSSVTIPPVFVPATGTITNLTAFIRL